MTAIKATMIVLVCFLASCRMPPLKRVPPGPVTRYDALMVAIQLHGAAGDEVNPLEQQKKLDSRDECFNAWLNARRYRFAKLENLDNPELERQRIIRFLTSSAGKQDLSVEYRQAVAQALDELGHMPEK